MTELAGRITSVETIARRVLVCGAPDIQAVSLASGCHDLSGASMKIYDAVPLGRLSAAEDGGGDPADAFGVCDRVDLDDLAQQVSSSRRPSIQTSRGMPGTVGPEPSTNPQRSA